MSWMQTFTGKKVDVILPSDIMFDIRDIAHSLSNQCRFAGHCRTFYSVAEHSIYVSMILPDKLKLCGLLHDATEAYLTDLPRPLKNGPLSNYKEIEDRVQAYLCHWFNVPYPFPREVYHADNVLLATEKRDLLSVPPAEWESLPPASDSIRITGMLRPMGPKVAEFLFLYTYYKLVAKQRGVKQSRLERACVFIRDAAASLGVQLQ